MIKAGDVITIRGYDYDLMEKTKKKYLVLQMFPFHVLCRNVKAGYHESFNTGQLIENGYIPNFKDVKENEGYMVKLDRYVNGNKLLDEGYCV